MSTPRTREELLRQLEEEQAVGFHGVTPAPEWAQAPLDQAEVIARRLRSIMLHPSMGDG